MGLVQKTMLFYTLSPTISSLVSNVSAAAPAPTARILVGIHSRLSVTSSMIRGLSWKVTEHVVTYIRVWSVTNRPGDPNIVSVAFRR